MKDERCKGGEINTVCWLTILHIYNAGAEECRAKATVRTIPKQFVRMSSGVRCNVQLH